MNNIEIVQSWIKNKLISKNGGINSRRTSTKSSFYKKNKSKLDFLVHFARKSTNRNIKSINEAIFWIMNPDVSTRCKICTNPVSFYNFKDGVSEFCSKTCALSKEGRQSATEKAKRTSLERYGNESFNNRDKAKSTSLERYGADNPSKSTQVKEKIKETHERKYGSYFSQTEEWKHKTQNKNKEQFGTEWASQSEEIKQKVKDTVKINFGVDNVYQSEEIKQKIQDDCKLEYGVRFHSQRPEVIEKVIQTRNSIPDYYENVSSKCKQTKLETYGTETYNNPEKAELTRSERYGVSHHNQLKQMTNTNDYNVNFILDNFFDNGYMNFIECLDYFNCTPSALYKFLKRNNIEIKRNDIISGVSKGEKEVNDYVISLGFQTKVNRRDVIPPLELDVFIPSKNIAIEYNGEYFHSDFSKTKDYHLTKTEMCLEHDIELLHIFEHEWLDPIKRDIWKSTIAHKLGASENTVFARKCKIVELSAQESSEFLELNHLQGNANANVKLGLVYNDELVALATFSKPRFNNKYDWELIRFASKNYYSVPGAFSKLLKFFKSKYTGNILSYANRRWSNGNVYRLFSGECEVLNPGYFYHKNGSVVTRYRAQKHKLNALLESFDESKTEYENMIDNGYVRVWDCGNYKFEL